jgi:hypothetical protein
MNDEPRGRFDDAYDTWSAARIVEFDQSSSLHELSTSLEHTQSSISEMVEAYRATGEILPAPMEGWHEAQAWIIARNLRSLRTMAQTGRQQVATRELLRRAQFLKALWDAYGAATGI